MTAVIPDLSDPRYVNKCHTVACDTQLDVLTTSTYCTECKHLMRIGVKVDRLGPAQLRYLKSTLPKRTA